LSDSKKPGADIDDLKAKLGLGGAAPQQQQGGVPAPAGLPGAPAPGAPAHGAPVPGAPAGVPAPSVPQAGGGAQAAPGGAPAPPFVQEQQQAEKAAAAARDPFAATPEAQFRISQMPSPASYQDDGVPVSDAEVGKSRKLLYIVLIACAIPIFGFGYYCGISFRSRLAYNLAIIDGRGVRATVKRVAKVFDGLHPQITQAHEKSTIKGGRKFDSQHIEYISANIKKNPFPPDVFSSKNYKVFEPMIVQNLFMYYNNWNILYERLKLHVGKTKNDQKAIEDAHENVKKLMQTHFGTVFQMFQGQLVSAIVILGASGEKKGKPTYEIQSKTGSYPTERLLYMAEQEEPVWQEPEKWVVPVDDRSRAGILSKASQSHFNEYASRLQQMAIQMKDMGETQRSLVSGLDEISQLETKFVFGFDVEEEIEAAESAGSQE